MCALAPMQKELLRWHLSVFLHNCGICSRSGRASGRGDCRCPPRAGRSGGGLVSPDARDWRALLGMFAEAADELDAAGIRFVFGGTPPVAQQARSLGFFEHTFDGSEPDEAVLAYLKGHVEQAGAAGAFPTAAPPLRPAVARGDPPGYRADRRGPSAGCDLAGDRPGCSGKLLPPRATGSSPDGRGRRTGALGRRLSCTVRRQPARQLPTAAHLFRHR
jgi:hypothetical protein